MPCSTSQSISISTAPRSAPSPARKRRPLDFSKGGRLESNEGVVCAAPVYHSALIEGIAELGLGAGE